MAFYEKKVPSHFPDWVHTVEVHTEDGTQRQVVVDDRAQPGLPRPAGLHHAAHLAVHRQEPREARPADLRPRPLATTTCAKVRRATRLVGELLDDLGLDDVRQDDRLPRLPRAGAAAARARLRRGARLRPRAAARCWSRRRPTCSPSSSARPSAATGSTSTSAATPTARPRCRRTPSGRGRGAGLDADHLGRALAGEAGPVHRRVRTPAAGPPRLPVGGRPTARAGAGQGPEEAGRLTRGLRDGRAPLGRTTGRLRLARSQHRRRPPQLGRLESLAPGGQRGRRRGRA